MKNQAYEEIVYSINIYDIQNVAKQFLGRHLNREELLLVKDSIGDYIDWFQSIENAIQFMVFNKQKQ
jgi:hypothetical protein